MQVMFQKGHKKYGGRKLGDRNKISLKLFNEFLSCLNEVEGDRQISRGKSFFRHIIELGYLDKTVGIAILKKLVPDKVYNAIEFEGNKDVKVKFELVSSEENKYGDRVIKRTT